MHHADTASLWKEPFQSNIQQAFLKPCSFKAVKTESSECPSVSLWANHLISWFWCFSGLHTVFFHVPCFLATLSKDHQPEPRNITFSQLPRAQFSPSKWSSRLPTLTHLVTITPVSCILCDVRQVCNCWIHVSRELIKAAKPINSQRNMQPFPGKHIWGTGACGNKSLEGSMAFDLRHPFPRVGLAPEDQNHCRFLLISGVRSLAVSRQTGLVYKVWTG